MKTINEVCEELGIKRDRIYRLIKKGYLKKPMRIHGKAMFDDEEVEKLNKMDFEFYTYSDIATILKCDKFSVYRYAKSGLLPKPKKHFRYNRNVFDADEVEAAIEINFNEYYKKFMVRE